MNKLFLILIACLAACQPYAPIPPIQENELGPASTDQIALGKELFHDPILSSDNQISCATCHESVQAFTDGQRFSKGVDGRIGKRNSPTLINTAYLKHLNWDGGTNTIETQMLVPINDPNELNSSIPEIVNKLSQNDHYVDRFNQVWKDSISAYTITRSIGAFVRSLRSFNSKYDKHLEGQYEYTNEEAIGEALFFSSRLKCGQCHTSPLFTNQEFLNNGLVTSPADSGRARITYKKEDLERFKVPTLRNIELTAPYMHDGRFQSLEEVVTHYLNGGQSSLNKSDLIQGFPLSPFEEKALISFLKCLTDEEMEP